MKKLKFEDLPIPSRHLTFFEPDDGEFTVSIDALPHLDFSADERVCSGNGALAVKVRFEKYRGWSAFYIEHSVPFLRDCPGCEFSHSEGSLTLHHGSRLGTHYETKL